MGVSTLNNLNRCYDISGFELKPSSFVVVAVVQ
jgi:hypothetical protein